MQRLGNYTLEHVLKFTATIPHVVERYDGNKHIVEYKGARALGSRHFHIGRDCSIDKYVSWLKQVYAAESGGQALPPKQVIEEKLKRGYW